ncbi:TPA: hypothetical protein R4193_005266, partial [Serratia marcescens]|uniref:hypothetical protein n=1 Tax=Serratia marcescens TaxID=615 RepID=UPI001C4182AE
MFKNLMLFATCFIASFFILNKIPVLKNLVDMTVNQVGDWMNAAKRLKSLEEENARLKKLLAEAM